MSPYPFQCEPRAGRKRRLPAKTSCVPVSFPIWFSSAAAAALGEKITKEMAELKDLKSNFAAIQQAYHHAGLDNVHLQGVWLYGEERHDISGTGLETAMELARPDREFGLESANIGDTMIMFAPLFGLLTQAVNLTSDEILSKLGMAAKNAAGESWKPGDDIYSSTNKGTAPSDRTVGRRFWMNEAENPSRGDYTPEDIERMKGGEPPQRYNADKGGIESMERSHEPIPKREGGKKIVPKWPQEHAQSDPQRRPGY